LERQPLAPWGLGRISHRDTGIKDYIYDISGGPDVYLYVIDSGIFADHSEFGGRVSWGKNFIDGTPILMAMEPTSLEL
jgi:subtilisin family serine protease